MSTKHGRLLLILVLLTLVALLATNASSLWQWATLKHTPVEGSLDGHGTRGWLTSSRWAENSGVPVYTGGVSYYVENGFLASLAEWFEEGMVLETLWNFDGTVAQQALCRETHIGTRYVRDEKSAPPWWGEVIAQTKPTAPWWNKE